MRYRTYRIAFNPQGELFAVSGKNVVCVDPVSDAHRVVISDRGLKEGQLEYQHRRDSAAVKVPADEVFDFVRSRLKM